MTSIFLHQSRTASEPIFLKFDSLHSLGMGVHACIFHPGFAEYSKLIVLPLPVL